MSASLVGSEMCIRDSPCLCLPPCFLPIASAFKAAPPVPSQYSVFRVPWSVSYTHLTLPTICSV
eukprot:5959244-Alexandrium_andersonii.AAC.1